MGNLICSTEPDTFDMQANQVGSQSQRPIGIKKPGYFFNRGNQGGYNSDSYSDQSSYYSESKYTTQILLLLISMRSI